MQFTGKAKLFGVLGYPVEHSVSPAMQNAALREAKVDGVYIPLAVAPEHLGTAMQGLRACGFRGVNVTIPHKVAIMEHLDAVDQRAREIGAVNTVLFQEGRAVGYNTDADGFVQSLVQAGVEVDKMSTAVLLGAGGAARAVAFGLHRRGVGRIVITARRAEQVAELMQSSAEYGLELEPCAWEALDSVLPEADMLINCTPIGMASHGPGELLVEWGKLHAAAIVCDLIYNPPKTEFLLQAEQAGHRIVNGQGMLVEQGALAFELWNGQEAPRASMNAAFQQAVYGVEEGIFSKMKKEIWRK